MTHKDIDKDMLFRSFLEGESVIDGMKLRPFTLGTYLTCEKRGLSMFTGGSVELTPAERTEQAIAFLYLQTAPIEEVIITRGNQKAFDEAVGRFSFTLPMSAAQKVVELIHDLCEQTANASVETISKPGGSVEENAPPN